MTECSSVDEINQKSYESQNRWKKSSPTGWSKTFKQYERIPISPHFTSKSTMSASQYGISNLIQPQLTMDQIDQKLVSAEQLRKAFEASKLLNKK